MKLKYYKVCRVKCKHCGDVLEHINKTKEDNAQRMIYCSCGQVALDPSASLYRIVGNSEGFEDLSEEWTEGERPMNDESKKRLARSIRKVLSNLDSDAKCFCYTNEPEFKELKAYLINTANKLDTKRTIPQKKGE